MERKIFEKSKQRSTDPVGSAGRLLLAFVGYLGVAAAGKLLGGAHHPLLWFVPLVMILAATSIRQTLAAAAYNGLVAGLFFNFFFLSATQELVFNSANKILLQLSFPVIGMGAALVERFFIALARHSNSESVAAQEGLDSSNWRPRSAALPASKESDLRWTR